MNGSTAQLADSRHPWIGLASFTEGDRDFFAGRGDEIEQLLRLVRRDTLTLLYGISGLGKTSLLQAGLFPVMREDDYLPVRIQLDYLEGADPLTKQVFDDIGAASAKARVDAPQPQLGETLWEYFHRLDNHFWSPRNDLVTPFLAFDQFEEFFTLGRESPDRTRRGLEFISEVADLVENRPPAALRDDPARAKEFSFKPVPLNVLLSMREDYLGDLDYIRSRFRALAQNRMRLRPMGEQQARDVIALGASLLAPGAEDRIVKYVAGAGANGDGAEITVAPALLSLVLRQLNERRLSRGPDAKITPDLLDLEQQKILEDFYLRTLQDFPVGVRNFIEDELLTATGYRDSCSLDDALSSSDVTQPILDELVNRRLLAYEDRHHARRVEITHDVLAPVIKASRDTRVAREALAEAERKNVEDREKQRVVQRVQTTGLALVLLMTSIWLLSTVFIGRRPDQGSSSLSAIYKELQKQAPESPDHEKIDEARRKLQQLAKESKPDSKGFYGNAQLYSDMSQIAETLAEGNELGTRDKLLASIYETLESEKSNPKETLKGANSVFKTLADNPQAAVARFVIDNYRREHDKRSLPLQVVSIIAVFVVAPIWIIRRFLGREPMTKWLWRRKRHEVTITKPANPFLRLFADFVDVLIAFLLGLLVAAPFGQLVGIVGLWINGEVSDTAWGINTALSLFAFMCCSGMYLLFCDAIKYTHHRSIGKIMFRLIPITLPPGSGAVTVGISTKRNGLLALAWVLMAASAFSPSANTPTLDFIRRWADTVDTLKDIGVVMFIVVAVEEFTLGWIKDGRTVFDRLSRTKIIRKS